MRDRSSTMRAALLLVAAGSTPFHAAGADDPLVPARLRLQAVRTVTPIVTDGRLDEEAWKTAPVADNFVQTEPHQGQPATEQTEVRVLYDDEYLYVGVMAFDAEPERIIVNDLKRDFDDQHADAFGFIVDTFRDLRNGFMFSINAGGARLDAQQTNEGREVNKNWDGIWHVGTRIAEDGWHAEIAISLRGLRFSSADPQTWGINFLRRVRHRNEESYWAPIPRTYKLSRVSLAGTLEGLTALRPGRNLRIKPYVMGSVGESDGPATRTGDVGLDVKYGITGGLAWDLTVNTDFSQVETDEQQINLTQFNLFFPEKREFFLENSGVFQMGPGTTERRRVSGIDQAVAGRQTSNENDLILFFSRRIGLSDDGRPIPIDVGTRLTGRVGRFSVGALTIHQEGHEESAPATFSVLRLRRDVLSASDAGAMVLSRDASDGTTTRVAAADVNLRFFRNLTMNGLAARSITWGDEAVPGDRGALRTAAGWQGALFDLRGSYTSIGDQFRDDIGFVQQTGVRKGEVAGGAHLRPRATSGWLREIYPHAGVSRVARHTGGAPSTYVDSHVLFMLHDGSLIDIGANPTAETLAADFVINRRRGIAIPAGRYQFTEHFVQLVTNGSARVSAILRYGTGAFYGGHRQGYDIGASTRVNERFNLSATVSRNDIDLPGGRFTTTLVSGRANYNFSTRMFVNALWQYNADARQWSSNIRFNVIHRPLSDVFLVFNERRDTRSGDLVDRAAIAKVTYMMPF